MAGLWTDYLWPLIVIVAQSLLLLVILLVGVAYILLADRKIWAAVQMRRGPNVVGPFGLLQSFADLLKFVLKEPIIPAGANKGVFLLAPLVTSQRELHERTVVVVEGDANVPGLLKLVIEQGAQVLAVIPHRETLEDLFVRKAVEVAPKPGTV